MMSYLLLLSREMSIYTTFEGLSITFEALTNLFSDTGLGDNV